MIAKPDTIRLAIEASQQQLRRVEGGKDNDLLFAYRQHDGGTMQDAARRYCADQVRNIKRLRNVLEFVEGEKF